MGKITTIFIGFDKKSGTFTSEKTGEVINYSNRVLKFITNSGQNAERVGYDSFSEKLKTSDIACILGVADNETAVDDALLQLLQKPVITSFAPKDDKMVLCYFSLEK